MNIDLLRAEYTTKLQAAKDLLEKTMRASQDHIVRAATASEPELRGRVMTPEEASAVQTLYDEAKALKGRLDQATNMSAMSTEIERLTAGIVAPQDRSQGRSSGGERRSPGSQFVTDPAYRAFIANGNHRRAGGWSSPTVELQATTLDNTAGSGGALVRPDYLPGFIPLGFHRIVVGDLIAPGTTGSNMIDYVKETAFTNAAAAVAQGAAKPESALAFTLANAPVQKIAHWIPVTEEMLEDSDQTSSIIDSRLRLGVALTEEDELVNGTGVAPHLRGFLHLAAPSPDIPLVAPDTNFDVIFKQITQIATTAYAVPDGIIMNPVNWATCQLMKTTQGLYIGAGPWNTPQTPTMWGLQVAVTPVMAVGKAMIGAYQTAAQLFRRGGMRVEATNSHQDFFVKNLVAIRAEERLALAVYRDAAFGSVSALL